MFGKINQSHIKWQSTDNEVIKKLQQNNRQSQHKFHNKKQAAETLYVRH